MAGAEQRPGEGQFGLLQLLRIAEPAQARQDPLGPGPDRETEAVGQVEHQRREGLHRQAGHPPASSAPGDDRVGVPEPLHVAVEDVGDARSRSAHDPDGTGLGGQPIQLREERLAADGRQLARERCFALGRGALAGGAGEPDVGGGRVALDVELRRQERRRGAPDGRGRGRRRGRPVAQQEEGVRGVEPLPPGLRGARRSLLRVPGEHPLHQGAGRVAEEEPGPRAQGQRLAVDRTTDDLGVVRTEVGRVAGDEPVEQGARSIDVGSRPDAAGADGLLRAEVTGGAGHQGAAGRAPSPAVVAHRQAEVGELGAPLGVEEHVRRG